MQKYKSIVEGVEMKKSFSLKGFISSDLGLLILLAFLKLVFHLLTNGAYGFYRDELGMLDDARHLAWGYVSYPPLTAFLMRISWDLFGQNLAWFRLFPALAESIIIVLAGLVARELGGGRKAVLTTAFVVAIMPVGLFWNTVFQYTVFECLWWVAICYLVLRLVNSEDPRYWLGIGAFIGLGVLTKYSILFYVIGLGLGMLLTGRLRWLKSPWLWAGAGLAFLIFLPNLIWLVQNRFIHLEFLASIHARDIRIGRTQTFLLDQLFSPVNTFTIPLWIAGLFFYFRSPSGKRYRLLGWMSVVPFVIYLLSQGRGYYTAPIYPALFAGGAVLAEAWLARLAPRRARAIEWTAWGLWGISGVFLAAMVLPLAPVGSGWWNFARVLHDPPAEEIGWQELVQATAQAWDSLPEADKAHAAILANYAEGGAVNLYGPAYGLPPVISQDNTGWLRGYGDPPPETVVLVGWTRAYADRNFNECRVGSKMTMPYNVSNEISRDHLEILICRSPKLPWPELWKQIRNFA
jgi:4-amino-4-deoxy-L-arabinose transferase-like glycosyltransferase